MDAELAALLERAKGYKMTPEERFEQRVSFVYGNLALDGCNVTKEQVRRNLIEMFGAPCSTTG